MQVCIYAFDLLYINGESLVSKPLRHRRDVLRSSFPQVEGEFMFASGIVTNDTDRVAEFLEESIKGKLHSRHFAASTVRWLHRNFVRFKGLLFAFQCFGPGLKLQPRHCRVTVLGKLFTPIVPLFTQQRNWQQHS